MSSKPAVDYSKLGRFVRGNAVSMGARGVGGTPVIEGFPEYIKSNNEKVISDRNGCFLTMGRDRPGSRISGYGHEHQAACIQMKVGRGALENVGAVDEEGNKIYIDNSPKNDAATYYMSQKANIDDYFDLRKGKVGMSRTRSAIALKADAVRIIGREGIKLVTRSEPKNSQTGIIEYVRGIDLIAGNDDTDLQPIVKGDNLVSALDAIIRWTGSMTSVAESFRWYRGSCVYGHRRRSSKKYDH